MTVAGGVGRGDAANQLATPVGLAVATSGSLYITDFDNHRVQKRISASSVTIGARQLTGRYAAMSGSLGSIARLYMAVFNRQPDDTGHGYWVSQVLNGMPLNEVVGFFVTGQEFLR